MSSSNRSLAALFAMSSGVQFCHNARAACLAQPFMIDGQYLNRVCPSFPHRLSCDFRAGCGLSPFILFQHKTRSRCKMFCANVHQRTLKLAMLSLSRPGPCSGPCLPAIDGCRCLGNTLGNASPSAHPPASSQFF